MNICWTYGEDNMIDGKFRAVKYMYIYKQYFRDPLVVCVADTPILFAVKQSVFGMDWLEFSGHALQSRQF
jgi:hypothetical protein